MFQLHVFHIKIHNNKMRKRADWRKEEKKRVELALEPRVSGIYYKRMCYYPGMYCDGEWARGCKKIFPGREFPTKMRKIVYCFVSV